MISYPLFEDSSNCRVGCVCCQSRDRSGYWVVEKCCARKLVFSLDERVIQFSIAGPLGVLLRRVVPSRFLAPAAVKFGLLETALTELSS